MFWPCDCTLISDNGYLLVVSKEAATVREFQQRWSLVVAKMTGRKLYFVHFLNCNHHVTQCYWNRLEGTGTTFYHPRAKRQVRIGRGGNFENIAEKQWDDDYDYDYLVPWPYPQAYIVWELPPFEGCEPSSTILLAHVWLWPAFPFTNNWEIRWHNPSHKVSILILKNNFHLF